MAEIKAKKGESLLSDKTINSAKPSDKDYLLPDGKCLYLNIKAKGTKVWTLRYTIQGTKYKTTIGNYPTISLANARKKRDEFLEKVANGINPTEEKRQKKIEAQTQNESEKLEISKQFHLVALEWLESKLKPEVAKITYDKTYRAIERDILPYFAQFKPDTNPTFENVISSKSINEIRHPEISELIIAKSKSALDTSYRLLNACNRIWRYAVSSGKADNNIVANIEASAILPKLKDDKHYPSTTDNQKIREILRFTDNYQGSIITKTALRLLPYICVRMGNLRTMKWLDLDFEKKIWTVTEHKTSKKIGTVKLPLSNQAIAILNEIKPITGHCSYVFPQLRNFQEPMSDNTLSKAFRDSELSGVITPHGFRAMFKSLSEMHSNTHNVNPKAIEACLFHKTEKDKVGDAYGHLADYTDQMIILLDWWADYLDEIKKS